MAKKPRAAQPERLWITAHFDGFEEPADRKGIAKLWHRVFHSANYPQWLWGVPLRIDFWWWGPIGVRTRDPYVTGLIIRHKFPQYTRLPAELRQQILRYAITSPSDAPTTWLCGWTAAEALIQAADYQLLLDLLAAFRELRRDHGATLPLCGCNPWCSAAIAGTFYDGLTGDCYDAEYLRWRYHMFHPIVSHWSHRFAVSHYWALGQLILRADEVRNRIIERVIKGVAEDEIPRVEIQVKQPDGSVIRSSLAALKKLFSWNKTAISETESKPSLAVTRK